MARKKFETKYGVYMNGDHLPDKYKDELDQIFETAEAIHGMKFVNHIKFVVNIESLIGMLIQNMEIRDHVEPDFLQNATSEIASQLVGAYAEANGLSETQQKEAIKLCLTMRGVVKSFEREMRAKKA